MFDDQSLYRQRRADALTCTLLFQHLRYISSNARADLFQLMFHGYPSICLYRVNILRADVKVGSTYFFSVVAVLICARIKWSLQWKLTLCGADYYQSLLQALAFG